VIVSAPASSGNLGPGFDCLGLALDVAMNVEPGAATLPEATGRHPALVGYREAGGAGPLGWNSKIPPGKGMGFSGASYVAGVAAAFVEQGHEIDDVRDDIFEIAAKLEGHPDNAAPSTYGGLTISTNNGSRRVPIKANVRVVVWVPNFEVRTNTSRAALPPTVSRADAVFNLGRVAQLVAGLTTGDLTALGECTGDRLHEPYRLPAIPQTRDAIEAACEAGALRAFLSGSGACAAAIVRPADADRIAAAMPTTDAHVKVLDVGEGVQVLASSQS